MVLGPTVVGELCHIKGAKAGAARHDADQSDEARHGFDNLMLLCRPHHKVVDDDEIAYSVERLLQMKQTHEATAGQMQDAEATTAATLLVSVQQSGGLVAGQVSADTINIYGGQPVQGDATALRAYFAPELARITAGQIWAIGRILPNYVATSMGRPHMPGDTWISLIPLEPDLYPLAPEFQRLAPDDDALLVEFYDSLRGVADTVGSWVGVHPLDDYNAWNVLLHKTTHNLKLVLRRRPGRGPG